MNNSRHSNKGTQTLKNKREIAKSLNNSYVIDPERLKRLLAKMIDIYSPSGKEEEILEYLYEYLKRNGLPVRKQQVDDSRYNLVVASEAETQLSFVGHLDTVIAHDLDNYGFSEEGDMVTGLGSADMKGGCGAMVEAFVSLWNRKGSPPPVALALVVGEEEEGDGANALAESDLQFSWALIGEPTALKPCLSNYGYLEIQITIKGKRVHASLANHGQNPIELMLRLIMRVARYIESKQPRLVYNIRDMFTSQAGFFVPDHCEAWVDMHMPPESPMGEIVTEIEELVERERKKNSQLDCMIRFHTIDAGYELPDKGPILEHLKDIYLKHSLPWKPEPFISHSDANRLWASGVRPILLGPGQLQKAHTSDESILFSEVVEAAEIYFEIANSIGEYI
jgi:acetylornithine deacetylase